MEDEKTKTRRDRFKELHRNCTAIAIWMFLSNHLPENEQMNLKQLKAMPTQDLIDLYNDLTEQQVKRMASRADAERRTIEALKKKGKWVDEVVEGLNETEAKNVHETAKAGANTGTPDRKTKPAATRGKVKKCKPETAAKNLHGSLGTPTQPGKGKGKSAGKAQEKPAKAQPEPKAGKGKGKSADGAGKATGEAGKRGRGAPQKNPTYTAIAPNAKEYNPKGFKPQATSDRMVVLQHIRDNKGQRTRDQIVEHFNKLGEDRNVDAALYYLGKYGFCRVSE